MNVKRVRSTSDPLFAQAMKLYQSSFPFHEQREQISQQRIMTSDAYFFGVISDDDGFAGAVLYWEAESFLYVEHFCILPERRNRGLGRQVLSQIGRSGKTVILEIDPPVDDISKRRKAFYERVGFIANPYVHIHPPYHEGYSGHELVVMSLPSYLTREEYDHFAFYLTHTVMEMI